MADDYSKIMAVAIEPHNVVQRVNTPAGPADETIEFNQFRVVVTGEKVAAANAGNPKLHVGYIGKQVDANFCPLPMFYKFVKGQQDWIADQAKQLHGKASPEPFVDVPPPE